MTPEEAQDIYHAAATVEYEKHRNSYSPVNQQKVNLAGYQAIIEAVENEQTVRFVNKYLEANPLNNISPAA